DGIAEQSAGAVANLVVNANRFYFGRLTLAGGQHYLLGSFDVAGNATRTITRYKKSSVIVSMHMDMSGASKQITGAVTCDAEGWTAPLQANLNVYSRANPFPTPARYTLALPPSD